VLDIARFFSVDPILLFDNTKATYSNVENAQLSFLNTTLLPIIEKIENEFTRKLILPSQRGLIELSFDLKNLLRADQNSQADFWGKLIDKGIVHRNLVAKELNLPKIEGINGEKYFISTNLQDADNLIVNAVNSLDNKLMNNTNQNPDKQILPVDDIQKQALNGAQISSLIEVISNVVSGILSKESSKQIIKSSFPSFTDDQINGMIDSIVIKGYDIQKQTNSIIK
ncbi:MAG: phage portal protein, partial [Bacteroidetes bacterium]|nr:phage portal protein [Bacteroidota bacterium]